MFIWRERLQVSENIHYDIYCRQILKSDLARCEGIADEVVADIDMFSIIMTLRVIGEVHNSLIIHVDRSRRRKDRRRSGVLRGLPLHRRIIMIFSYIRRKGFDTASFDFV